MLSLSSRSGYRPLCLAPGAGWSAATCAVAEGEVNRCRSHVSFQGKAEPIVAKRRETGRSRGCKSFDEGLAIHIVPESCAESAGLGEALTGSA